MTTEKLLYATRLLNACPPWLRRSVGGKLMGAFGDVLDTMIDATVDGAFLRFPRDTSDDGAIAAIGRERRILRGPGEPTATYAQRLRQWLTSHQTRGNAYALATQLYLYFKDSLNPDFEIVSAKGNRLSVDTLGVMVRDQLTTWAPSDGWAHVWIFFHVTSTEAAAAAADHDTYASVPREWSAAHIPYITLVFLYDTGRVIGYPPSATIGDGYNLGVDAPVIFTTET